MQLGPQPMQQSKLGCMTRLRCGGALADVLGMFHIWLISQITNGEKEAEGVGSEWGTGVGRQRQCTKYNDNNTHLCQQSSQWHAFRETTGITSQHS